MLNEELSEWGGKINKQQQQQTKNTTWAMAYLVF